MPSKTISISAEKWDRVKDAFAKKFPIPEDEKTHEPEHTENEWPFVYLKKLVARIVRAHERNIQGVSAPEMDEDMVTFS